MKTITKEDHINAPMTDNARPLQIKFVFSEENFDKIKLGHLPMEQEDKWFIFYENDWVYFHRSWTGVCIYKMKLEKDGEEIITSEVWVERDPEIYNNANDKTDMNILDNLVAVVLLETGRPIIPDPSKVTQEQLVAAWSVYGKYLFYGHP